METSKKIIACFGLQAGNAVLINGQVEDYLTLSRYYSDNGADGLFLYDRSEDEKEHEQVIAMIKQIHRVTDIPIITGGNIRRLEDVKKYLYAGASAVYLDGSCEEQVDLIKEAGDRFGTERVMAYLPSEAYIGRTEEFAQLGASAIILESEGMTMEALNQISHCSVGYYFISQLQDQALACLLQVENAMGVILQIPAKTAQTPMDIKHTMRNYDITVDTFQSAVQWEQFKTNSDGLIPVVVQDYKTLEVLMVAYMNQQAFQATLRSGKMTYYSRSRQSLWLKGETSGHVQYVKSLHLDCDNDTLLAKVAQVGCACHTGANSCFFQTLLAKDLKVTNPLKVFEDVFQVIQDRKINPREGSYTNYLFDKGLDKILKKVGEETTEIVIAAKNPDPEEVRYEISDLLYHLMVLMAEKGLSWEEITEELANR